MTSSPRGPQERGPKQWLAAWFGPRWAVGSGQWAVGTHGIGLGSQKFRRTKYLPRTNTNTNTQSSHRGRGGMRDGGAVRGSEGRKYLPRTNTQSSHQGRGGMRDGWWGSRLLIGWCLSSGSGTGTGTGTGTGIVSLCGQLAPAWGSRWHETVRRPQDTGQRDGGGVNDGRGCIGRLGDWVIG
jgi:hypothetical protein